VRPGVINEAKWAGLCDIVIAASRQDANAARAAIHRLADLMPNDPPDWEAGVYLLKILQYRVVEILGQWPSADDLHTLAARFNPKFRRLIAKEDTLLEDTLRSVCGMTPIVREVIGATRMACGSAALGVMLNRPRKQLASMKPFVSEWVAANFDEMRADGSIPADARLPDA